MIGHGFLEGETLELNLITLLLCLLRKELSAFRKVDVTAAKPLEQIPVPRVCEVPILHDRHAASCLSHPWAR